MTYLASPRQDAANATNVGYPFSENPKSESVRPTRTRTEFCGFSIARLPWNEYAPRPKMRGTVQFGSITAAIITDLNGFHKPDWHLAPRSWSASHRRKEDIQLTMASVNDKCSSTAPPGPIGGGVSSHVRPIRFVWTSHTVSTIILTTRILSDKMQLHNTTTTPLIVVLHSAYQSTYLPNHTKAAANFFTVNDRLIPASQGHCRSLSVSVSIGFHCFTNLTGTFPPSPTIMRCRSEKGNRKEASRFLKRALISSYLSSS